MWIKSDLEIKIALKSFYLILLVWVLSVSDYVGLCGENVAKYWDEALAFVVKIVKQNLKETTSIRPNTQTNPNLIAKREAEWWRIKNNHELITLIQNFIIDMMLLFIVLVKLKR